MFHEDDVNATGKLKMFHLQVAHLYEETCQLCQDLVAQRLNVETARQTFTDLSERADRLRTDIHLHYWLMRAYTELCPEKSTNRLFLCSHCRALNDAWEFIERKTVWRDVEFVNEAGVAELKPRNVSLGELAKLASFFGRRLPKLDAELAASWRAEVTLAIKMLTKDKRAEIDPEELHGGSTAVELILGEESREILEIVHSDGSVDNKMRNICGIDMRYLAWTSPQWAELLHRTDAAVRRTAFWKNDRPQAIEMDRNLREDEDD